MSSRVGCDRQGVAGDEKYEQQRRKEERMGVASRVGDWAFKGFTAGLGVATIYLTATFSVNVYRGLAWHNSQSKTEEAGSNNQTP